MNFCLKNTKSLPGHVNRPAKLCALIYFIWLLLFSASQTLAADTSTEICVYVTGDNRVVQVRSLEDVPVNLRKSAKCFRPKQDEALVQPKEIELEGNVRRESMVSSIGPIELRWPRKVETLFGRTPRRALAEAAQAVNRAIKRPGFPAEVERMRLEWQVVFMDENLPEQQIPAYLVSNCHPGWMTPPANIYIVAQRVAAGCGDQRRVSNQVADSELAEVLIHEMGHAVEHVLLTRQFGNDRARAEGFATWFEQYASEFSSVIPRGSVKKEHNELAKQAFAQSPDVFTFRGSGNDYARASLYFRAIVEKRKLAGLMSVYEVIAKDGLDFFTATEKRLDWNRAQLEKEAAKLVGG